MHPAGRPGELFAAFSHVIDRAFRDERLIACPTLSKAPNYGNVLRRFLLRAPLAPLGLVGLCRIVLRYVLSNGLHLCFMLLGALFLRLLRWKRPACFAPEALRAPAKPLFIIDTFAVLPKIAKDDAFQELYMPGLDNEAVRCGHEVVFLYRLYGSRDPRVLWRAFKVLAARGGGLTELHLLTGADWLRLLGHMLLYPFSLLRLIRSLRQFAPGSAESAIREALIHTAGQCVLIGEARRLAAWRLGLLLSLLPPWVCAPEGTGGEARLERRRAASIASWYENQTLNKAFQRGLATAEARTGRHTHVTGAQLFIWPDTLLNNHADDVESHLRLTPDRILVNGPHFLPDDTRQSYAVGPSLRYGDLFAASLSDAAASSSRPEPGVFGASSDVAASSVATVSLAAGAPKVAAPPSPVAEAFPAAPSVDAKPLLVLLSYHPDEIRRVLNLVLPLAQAGRAVAYKFHPATRPEDFAAMLPIQAVFAPPSLKVALQQAGAVLGSGSGSLAEAVAQGIFVLNVEDPAGIPGLGLNYLPDYGKGFLWESVRHAEDVEKALAAARRAQASSDAHTRREQVRTFRDLLFTEPTPERIREAFEL